MSIAFSLSWDRPAARRRIYIAPATLPTMSPAMTLIGGGALVASTCVLFGLVLLPFGMLTLIWIKILPIPTLLGLIAVCVGILILCINALREPICQSTQGYRS